MKKQNLNANGRTLVEELEYNKRIKQHQSRVERARLKREQTKEAILTTFIISFICIVSIILLFKSYADTTNKAVEDCLSAGNSKNQCEKTIYEGR
jgi:hypothetical protein